MKHKNVRFLVTFVRNANQWRIKMVIKITNGQARKACALHDLNFPLLGKGVLKNGYTLWCNRGQWFVEGDPNVVVFKVEHSSEKFGTCLGELLT